MVGPGENGLCVSNAPEQLPQSEGYDGSRIARQGLTRRRFSINTAASLVNYGFQILVGIWYTPYMLAKLPEQVYGIIPLTTAFLQYMLLLMTSLSASIGRYVTADLSRGDIRAANATFNGFFFGGLKLIAGLAAGIALFCIVLPIRVPPGFEGEARFLAAAVFGSSLLMGFSNCFDTAIWATSRIELRHMIESAAIVVRNGGVVILFALTAPSIWQVGAAVIAAAVLYTMALFVVWKKLTPELRIDHSAITEETKGIIYTTGRWVLLANLATALLMSSDLIVINRFYDTAEGAKYAVVLLWVSVVRSTFTGLLSALTPSLVALEARKDHDYLLSLISRSIRISGALVAHSAAILAGMSLPILTVWLKKPWVAEAAPVAWLLLLPLSFEISFSSLMPAILTTKDRVRSQALVSFAVAVLGVAAAVVLVKTTGLGLYAVALGAGCASIARYAIVNPLQATVGFEGVARTYFLRQGLPILLRFAFTAAVTQVVANWMQPNSYLNLAFCALVASALTLPLSVLLLPEGDRAALRRLLGK